MGTPASFMDLELYSASDKFLQKIEDNDALLGSYPVDDDCRIHVCNSDVLNTSSDHCPAVLTCV